MKEVGTLALMILLMVVVTATQAEARLGNLTDLVMDQNIGNDTPRPSIIKEKSAPVKVILDSKKDNVYSVVKKLQQKVFMQLNVEFDSAKYFIKQEYHNDIKKIADFMKDFPNTKVVIKGHTDNVGNVRLSRSRAKSLRKYLIEKFGIDGSRITTFGYGYFKPIADNYTEEGRQKNRRVEIFIKEVKAK